MKIKSVLLAVCMLMLISCKKESVQLEQRQSTYYTSVVFNYPVRTVDSIAWWTYVWPQVVENPVNLSFTIVPGRQADGPMKVVSWKVLIDNVLVKQSSSKRDLSYPQIVPVTIPITGIAAPYRGDVSKTWHLISVYGKHSDSSSFADGIYFYR